MSNSHGLALAGEPLVSTRISERGREPTNGRGARQRRAAHPFTAQEKRGQRSADFLPKHVRNCAGTGGRSWYVYTWKRGNPQKVTRAPYMCGSWRCPVCKRFEASVTFARVRDAFAAIGEVVPQDRGVFGPVRYVNGSGYDPSRVGFFVLTLDRDGYHTGEPWADEQTAYRKLGEMARKFMRQINELARRQGVEPIGNRWVGTVEAHKSGWPHYQLMVYLPEQWAEDLPTERGFAQRDGREDSILGELRQRAERAGWGRRSSFERARDESAVLGYLIDTASKHDKSRDRVRGELLKLSQLPTNAPNRFRRLRAGKGFLPLRNKARKTETTGTLIRRRICEDGTPQAFTLHEIKDGTSRQVAAECCYKEEHIWRAEAGQRDLVPEAWLRAVPSLLGELQAPHVLTFSLPKAPRGPPLAKTCGARQRKAQLGLWGGQAINCDSAPGLPN